jgi:hypothetical protein
MKCNYCHKDAQWVSNEKIYGRRYGQSYMIWHCEPCKAYVGCHRNTKRPLGTLAKIELRELRKKAHSVFDPLYRDFRSATRTKEYKHMSEYFGKEMHIGESDEQQCLEIISYAESRYKDKLKARAHTNRSKSFMSTIGNN